MTPKETDVFDNNCQPNKSTFYDFFDAYNEGPAFCNCDRGKKKTNEVDHKIHFVLSNHHSITRVQSKQAAQLNIAQKIL